MKNIKQGLSILLFVAFLITGYTAAAQNTRHPKDTVETIGTSSTGADATGPEAVNTAHGKPLDTTGVVIPRKVTYHYFNKDHISPKAEAIKDSAIAPIASTAIASVATADTTHQTAATAVTDTGTHCGCCWGWLGLLGLFGLLGLKKKATT